MKWSCVPFFEVILVLGEFIKISACLDQFNEPDFQWTMAREHGY